jgi:hypothetical protein
MGDRTERERDEGSRVAGGETCGGGFSVDGAGNSDVGMFLQEEIDPSTAKPQGGFQIFDFFWVSAKCVLGPCKSVLGPAAKIIFGEKAQNTKRLAAKCLFPAPAKWPDCLLR